MSAELDLQVEFSQEAALLIQQARQLGYGVTLGEAWRSPQQAAWDAQHGTGIAHSLHIEKLAIDINLFKQVDGSWQYISDGEGHTELGAWWKARGANRRWGGDFATKDYNHYSISADGVRA